MENRRGTDFIRVLRIFAAFIVLISHIMFKYYSGEASNILTYLRQPTTGAGMIDRLNELLEWCGISFGPLGVSIFFLISGFCTCISAEKKNFRSFWKSRILRIYPTYIVAFSITFLSIFTYVRYLNESFPYTFKDWLIQVSLLRDWLWNPSVDGLSWTLEIQLKVYLVISAVICIYQRYNSGKAESEKKDYQRSLLPLQTVLAVLYFCFYGAMKMSADSGLYPYAVFYVLCFSIPLISYSLIGASFYQHYMGRLSDKGLMIHLLVGALEYCICFSHGIYSTGIKPRLVSYTIGLVIFIGAYLTGMRARGKIVESLSKISYPLYAAQGSCYIIMSVLDHEAGLSPYMNILITGVILFIIAYIVSIIVGVPGQLMKAFSSGER